MSIFPAGSSLIDIITRAKAMQGKSAAPAPAPAPPQAKKLEDQVTLSPKLQDKIDAGQKVNAYLQVFSVGLKLINAGKRLPDLTAYFDRIDTKAKSSGKFDTKI